MSVLTQVQFQLFKILGQLSITQFADILRSLYATIV